MGKFRNNPPKEINDVNVNRMLDYLLLTETDFKTKKTSALRFSASDVIQFYLEDGTKVSVRPSGTEPKIKFYISVNAELKSKGEFERVSVILDQKIKAIEQYLIK